MTKEQVIEQAKTNLNQYNCMVLYHNEHDDHVYIVRSVHDGYIELDLTNNKEHSFWDDLEQFLINFPSDEFKKIEFKPYSLVLNLK